MVDPKIKVLRPVKHRLGFFVNVKAGGEDRYVALYMCSMAASALQHYHFCCWNHPRQIGDLDRRFCQSPRQHYLLCRYHRRSKSMVRCCQNHTLERQPLKKQSPLEMKIDRCCHSVGMRELWKRSQWGWAEQKITLRIPRRADEDKNIVEQPPFLME